MNISLAGQKRLVIVGATGMVGGYDHDLAYLKSALLLEYKKTPKSGGQGSAHP
jgi:hypothetical protein